MLRLEKAAQLMRQNFHKVKIKVKANQRQNDNFELSITQNLPVLRSLRRQCLSSAKLCWRRRTFYTHCMWHISRCLLNLVVIGVERDNSVTVCTTHFVNITNLTKIKCMHFGYSEQYANLTLMSVLVVMKCRVRTRVTLISGKSSSDVVKGLCSGMHNLSLWL